MDAVHSLLKRQLKRHFGAHFSIPADWRAFINAVNDAYHEFDTDRAMLEHSLELSSKELIDANAEMRAVFQAIPDLMFRLNHQGTLLDINAGTTGDMEIERRDWIGKRIQETPLKDVASQFSEALQRVIAEKALISIEYAAMPQGRESYHEARLVPLGGEQVVVIVRDITERKQSLRLLGTAVEQSSESIVITDAELDFPGPRILFVNPAFTQMTGYTAGEVLGKTPRILQGPKSDRATLRRLRETLGRGEIFTGETVNYRKDGTDFDLEWQVAPIRNSSGSITHFLGIQRDITARKQAENALRQNEALLRIAGRAARLGGWAVELPEVRVTWSDEVCAILEVPPGTVPDFEEALGFYAPQSRDSIRRAFEACVQQGTSFDLELEVKTSKGHRVWVRAMGEAQRNAAGVITRVQGAFQDITERKRADAKLRETSGLLDAMLENSPDLIYFKDLESRFIRISKGYLPRVGHTDPKMVHGKTDADFYAASHAQRALADEQEIIRTGQPLIGKMEKETYPDGHVTWALTTKMPWRDGSGAIIGTFGISKDVTAMKEAESRLAYERDQLRALLDSSPDTIHFKDAQSRFVLASQSKVQNTLARVLDVRALRTARDLPADVPDSELLTGLTDLDIHHDDDSRLVYEDEQRIVRTGEPIIGKLEKQAFLDGTVRWSLTSRMPWRDRDGKIIGTFGISRDITDLKEAEEKLERMHRQLLETSRQAGMAEVATAVLHNVGNVLNSVNVSATLVSDQVRRTKAANIAKLAALLAQNKATLGDFLTKDPRGRMIPDYLDTLAADLAAENQALVTELEHLRKNVDHIKDIVAMQQAYARTSGVIESISVPDMIEDALRINAGSLVRHDIDTIRDYQARPVVATDKHKVMQILINLVRNAKYACDESGRTDKEITVRTTSDERGVKIAVIDNGIGVPAENLARIFNHGFTTRKHGHGFGLHSGALAARELGGSLKVHSDGIGRGATFILELPYKPEPAAHEYAVG